jgi:prepilin-type N-terminal cleavage/methylation domain-containing protein
MQRVRRAFTLIELLVVIAIIAILAAILFPVFAQAREAARKSTCVSNENQCGKALMMYVQDYDELYPTYDYAGTGGPSGMWSCDSAEAGNIQQMLHPQMNGTARAASGKAAWHGGWAVVSMPYIKNVQALRCPNMSKGWPGPSNHDWCVTTYISPALNFHSNYGTAREGAALASFEFPAEVALLMETWSLHGAPAWTDWTSQIWEGPVLFADGHVKYKKQRKCWGTDANGVKWVPTASPPQCVAWGSGRTSGVDF